MNASQVHSIADTRRTQIAPPLIIPIDDRPPVVPRNTLDPRARSLVAKAYAQQRLDACGCRECLRAKSDFFAPRPRTCYAAVSSSPNVWDWMCKTVAVICTLLLITAGCMFALGSGPVDWIAQ